MKKTLETIPKIDRGSGLTTDCSFQKKAKNSSLSLDQNTVRLI